MDATPTLSPGLTLLDQPERGALHRLVLDRDAEGEVLWVDAGGAASTYGLTAQEPTRRALRGIRVARAFTAHQHHELVRRAVAEASERTGLLVAPHLATLYDVDDAPAAELDRLFAASVELLAACADALSVPALVSAPRADADRRALIADHADHEIDCEATDLGYAYDAEDFTQPGYWQAGWWQTTIPYWVELCGAGPDVGAALGEGAPDVARPAADPAEAERPPAAGQADLGGW